MNKFKEYYRTLEDSAASSRKHGLAGVLQENVDHHLMPLTLRLGQYLVQVQLKWADEALKTL